MADQHSKKYGSKRGFAAAWAGPIIGFAVAGPVGLVAGLAAGSAASRKINTGSWTGAYDDNPYSNKPDDDDQGRPKITGNVI